jgi:hypothetical protein
MYEKLGYVGTDTMMSKELADLTGPAVPSL